MADQILKPEQIEELRNRLHQINWAEQYGQSPIVEAYAAIRLKNAIDDSFKGFKKQLEDGSNDQKE